MYTAEFTKEQRKTIFDAVFNYEWDADQCIEICEKIRDEWLI